MELAEIIPAISMYSHGRRLELAAALAPFVRDKLKGAKNTRITRRGALVLSEPHQKAFALRLRRRCSEPCCLNKMYARAYVRASARIHSGGFGYHGMASIVNELHAQGGQAVAMPQRTVFACRPGVRPLRRNPPAPQAATPLRVARSMKRSSAVGRSKRASSSSTCTVTGHSILTAYDDATSTIAWSIMNIPCH